MFTFLDYRIIVFQADPATGVLLELTHTQFVWWSERTCNLNSQFDNTFGAMEVQLNTQKDLSANAPVLSHVESESSLGNTKEYPIIG